MRARTDRRSAGGSPWRLLFVGFLSACARSGLGLDSGSEPEREHEPDAGPTDPCAEPVRFPDPALDEAVRNGRFGPEQPLSRLDLAQVRGFYVEGVSSLAGAECLTALSSLAAVDGTISDLRPLAGLALITWLDLSRNAIEDLSPLASSMELEYVTLTGNRIRDLSPLSGHTKLVQLDVSSNLLESLEPLQGLRIFNVLADDNSLTDLAPLEGMPNLQSVDVANNRIADLSPLAGSRLKHLGSDSNQIADLGPLGQQVVLYTLSVRDNSLTDLRALSTFTGLRDVDAGYNRVSSLDGVVLPEWGGVWGCGTLDLSYNSVDAGDVAPLCAMGWNVTYGDPPRECRPECLD
jgi:hypothetical protein